MWTLGNKSIQSLIFHYALSMAGEKSGRGILKETDGSKYVPKIFDGPATPSYKCIGNHIANSKSIMIDTQRSFVSVPC